ncbi:IclR family transcriptional regulator [Microvirga antarctica]|uniref:IclR family transcriptional regulator n=1 Tax=Microvirga antarctica TaxID=2819233 RepID=UPI001B301780|nr:IclR family transcriptional regulator [Microvirga antarctica]
MAVAPPTGTQALERGVALLKEVAASEIGGARMTDLAARSGLSRSTTHRLLDCLVQQDLVRKDNSGRYHLGRGVYELGLLATHSYDMSAFSFGPLRDLATALGDTVFLTRRVGLDMVCVERVEGDHSYKVLTMTIGTRRPIGIGAGGLALLAALEPAEANSILAANAKRFEAYYGASISAKLSHRLQIARRNGYAFADGVLTDGVAGIGIAVHTPKLVPILSLSIVSSRDRLSGDRRDSILREMRHSASAIANLVGSS